MTSNQFEQIDDFELLEDWEERYRYVIEMEKDLAQLSEQDKNINTKVNGCASQVWLLQNASIRTVKCFFTSLAIQML